MTDTEVTRVRAKLSLDDEGALSNPRMEQYALLIVDGVTRLDAWRLVDPKQKGGSGGNYRANVEKNPVFKDRLAYLMTRKEFLLKQGIWGQLQWQAEQMYATARATNDSLMMTKATELLFKVADRTTVAEPTEGEEGAGGKRGVGAPVAENPQVASSAMEIRNRLMAMGRQVEDPEEEAADEA